VHKTVLYARDCDGQIKVRGKDETRDEIFGGYVSTPGSRPACHQGVQSQAQAGALLTLVDPDQSASPNGNSTRCLWILLDDRSTSLALGVYHRRCGPTPLQLIKTLQETAVFPLGSSGSVTPDWHIGRS